LHAVWLAESNVSLGRSLTDVLQVGGERPTLNPNEMIATALADPQARARARARFLEIVQTLWDSQDAPDWFTEDWLDRTLAAIPREFDRACDRWRGLYRAAQAQREIQHRILGDASRNHREKKIAEKLRFEAETQLALLESAEDLRQSDFYSYRYFAAEGFLPGYNFPRLPVAAYIPARRGFKEETEYLSRPRFLGISEFGPRAVVYHEGSRYVIERAILPVRESEAGGELPTGRAKQCGQCGYMHPIANSSNPDVCERCGARLENSFTGLLRLQNVQTRRRDKISSDEEERMRLGYELTTGVRFSERDHRPDCRVAVVEANGERIATLTYGERAVIWRVNLGWRRRKNKAQYGFCIDAYTGQWAKNEIDPNDDADDDLSLKKGVTERVIPYVEDYRNCLLLEFPEPPKPETVASLQAALRRGIQACFQLEENELAVEPLPDVDRRRLILFYEATEGGAGVLKQLLDDPTALRRVARDALTVCHYDSATGADLRRAPHGREDCEAACYDCLLSYDNQPDHPSLDRHLAAPFLTALLTAKVFASPTAQAPHDHVAALKRKCDSTLERDWLEFALAGGHRPPSHAQILIDSCGTRPDFLYEAERAAIYVDGPHHEFPERRERDRIQSECLEDGGWTVIRFGVREDWKVIFAKYPSVFGRGKKD
jgi:hypothetical protein